MGKKAITVLVLVSCLIGLGSLPVYAGMGGFGGAGAGKKKKKKAADLPQYEAPPGMAKLLIFVSPKATLYANDVPKGTSEKFTLWLDPGAYKIRVEKDGFETQVREIKLEPDKPHSMNFVLMKKGQVRGEAVLIPAGKFWMGLDDYDLKFIIRKIGGEKRFHRNEMPRRQEEVGAYYMDKYEVTNQEYQGFVKATGHTPPDGWEGGSYPAGKALHPVVDVSWHDADAYCKWAGKRLPTEKEWEKAARWSPGRDVNKKGDDSTLYPWGNTFHRNKLNSINGGPGETTPTGAYEKGKSAYDIYDMAGNVKEWVADWYADYPGNEFVDKFTTGEKVKVARGGSFLENEYDCFGSCRFKYSPGNSDEDLGFRCAKDAK